MPHTPRSGYHHGDLRLVATAITGVFPGSDPRDLALGGWGVVHGLAFLYLDRKVTAASMDEISAQVRASVLAVFGAMQGR